MMKLTQEQKELLEAQANISMLMAEKMKNVNNGYSKSALMILSMIDKAEVDEQEFEQKMAA